MFDNQSMAQQFGVGFGGVGRYYLSDKIDDFRRDMLTSIYRLKTIQRKLEFIPEGPPLAPVDAGPNEPTVFISHSSKDDNLISTISQAFVDLDLRPLFNEKTPASGPPVPVIAEHIAKSKALFVFFTTNSTYGETRGVVRQ